MKMVVVNMIAIFMLVLFETPTLRVWIHFIFEAFLSIIDLLT